MDNILSFQRTKHFDAYYVFKGIPNSLNKEEWFIATHLYHTRIYVRKNNNEIIWYQSYNHGDRRLMIDVS